MLKHVRPLEHAIENMRKYLRSSGVLGVQLSGTFSTFGLVNQVVPQRLAVWLLQRLLDRDPESVFRAYYHHCWYTRLEEAFEQMG